MPFRDLSTLFIIFCVFRKFFLLAALLTVGLIGFYLFMDMKVGRAILARESNNIPLVYSDTFKLTKGIPWQIDYLRNILSKRQYREVTSLPTTPGEFLVGKAPGNLSVHLITREFIAPDGIVYPSKEVTLDLARSEILLASGTPLDVLVLEPEIISRLGTGSLRSSELVALEDIPRVLIAAVISIEDERFFGHFGIDLQGIGRALFANLKALKVVEGGSTITQQLAKNLILTPERTLGRKVLEVFAALSLERRLSKEKILELYLNEVYLGQEGSVAIHGVSEAAKTFFGKNLKDLTMTEAALIAALIKAPSYYSPRKHPQRALKRRNLVLERMAALHAASAAEYQTAIRAPLQVFPGTFHKRTAPHYHDALYQELAKHFYVEGALYTGLSVFSGIDTAMQSCAETALEQGFAKLEEQHPKLLKQQKILEGALVSIEPYSGKIRAWVGGRDFQINQFDHVQQARRQIGSTIKPFLYLTAFDHNLNTFKTATPLSVVADSPLKVNLVTQDTWEPENYDRAYRGDVTFRYALENSLNIPAVRLGQQLGIAAFAKTLKRFHLAEDAAAVPALALGAADTTLLELTAAYGALANGGIYVRPRLFISAYDQSGDLLTRNAIDETRIAAEAPVFVLTNILQGVIERGTGKTIRRTGYAKPAAGKTGTSNEARDAWFIGYTPDLVTGVWLGFDDNSKTGLTGGGAAAPIWAAYMKCLEPSHRSFPFLPPDDVTFVEIDTQTGELRTPECPANSVTQEVFVRGTEPRRACHKHGGYLGEEIPDVDILEKPSRRKRKGLWDMLFG